jgi:hypothetical protein
VGGADLCYRWSTRDGSTPQQWNLMIWRPARIVH